VSVIVSNPITISKSDEDAREDAQKQANEGALVKWTKVLGVATGILAFSTAILFAATVAVALYTKRLLAETSRAGAAALNGQRPYLYVSGVDVLKGPGKLADGTETYVVTVTFKNYGRTPAFVRAIGHAWTIGVEEDLPAVPVYDYALSSDTAGLVIERDGTFDFHPYAVLPITPEQRASSSAR
jgi:hypothetical protein